MNLLKIGISRFHRADPTHLSQSPYIYIYIYIYMKGQTVITIIETKKVDQQLNMENASEWFILAFNTL